MMMERSIRLEAERVVAKKKETHEDDGCPCNTTSTLQTHKLTSEDRVAFVVYERGGRSASSCRTYQRQREMRSRG